MSFCLTFQLVHDCGHLCPTGQSTLKAKLARSGHAAAVVGTKIVITGGILRDGSLIVDVVVIDLPTMSVIRCDVRVVVMSSGPIVIQEMMALVRLKSASADTPRPPSVSVGESGQGLRLDISLTDSRAVQTSL